MTTAISQPRMVRQRLSRKFVSTTPDSASYHIRFATVHGAGRTYGSIRDDAYAQIPMNVAIPASE